MPLTENEINTLRLLFREEMEPLRTEMHSRFNEVIEQLEVLYQRDEKREQEYLFSNEQVSRLDKQVSELAKKIA